MRLPKRVALTTSVAAVLALGGSPASASVTLGQLAPGNPPAANCTNIREDWVEPTVSSGNSYEVPPTVASGTITSWSTNAAANAGQVWTMKVFRRVSGSSYTVVAHDGPHDLTSGALNTFQTSIAVRPGDLLGMNDNDTLSPVSTTCAHVAAGNTVFFRIGSLADGQMGTFSSAIADRHLNIQAVLDPTNTFTLGTLTRNRKQGTATLNVDVPNPGELTVSGPGVKSRAAGAVISKAVSGPGTAQLLIKAKGKKKRKLNHTGKVKLNVAVTYTPTGGNAGTQSVKVKLRKANPKRR